ncbi:MAG: STAS domain-containing protein [Anaerolineales bacterium]|nr:STAS domain-containing protein [Anaerolineales bacterium]
MEITQKEYKRVNAVEIAGRIDSATSGEFESVLVDLAERGRNNIVLDMSAVEFISSAGLRVLVTIRKAVQSAGGDVVLAAPSERVTDTLEIAGLDVLFTTYPDRESAIASF